MQSCRAERELRHSPCTTACYSGCQGIICADGCSVEHSDQRSRGHDDDRRDIDRRDIDRGGNRMP